MAGATVITGGTYLLELSSGYDGEAFYLDQSQLDGPDVLDGDGEDFNDITDVAQANGACVKNAMPFLTACTGAALAEMSRAMNAHRK